MEYWLPDEEEVKAQDYQQLCEEILETQERKWDTEQNMDEHDNWSSEEDVQELEDKIAHLGSGHLEARCEHY